MTTRNTFPFALALLGAAVLAPAQQGEPQKPAPAVTPAATPAVATQDTPSFAAASADLQQQLVAALAELTATRERITAEKLPMAQQLRDLEQQLLAVRGEYQQAARLVDTRSLDLTNLTAEVAQRKDQAGYLSNLLTEYGRNFESRLHIAELQLRREPLQAARLALDDAKSDQDALFEKQIDVVAASLARVEDVLGGTRFQGKAVDSGGVVKAGTFVLFGPTAIFRSADGQEIGVVEQRLGSLEPAVVPFKQPVDREAAAAIALGTGNQLPFDPTLGNATKAAAIEETWVEHVLKGGPVMWPIFALAGAALLVVLLKWLSMAFVRRPSRKSIDRLLEAVRSGQRQPAVDQAEAVGGPAGAMLKAGAEHLGEPRELVEEVMFEQLLQTRLRLNSWLPFVAISATSAPLLGLLGTVTGIMNTFTLMTVYGTGDPKTLSSGISEALITTEYGLIVAIPSLLLHALLARRAKGIVDDMEKAAVAFLNQVRKSEPAAAAEVA